MSEADSRRMLAAIAKKRAQGSEKSTTLNDEFVLPANHAAEGSDASVPGTGRRKGKRSDPDYKQTGVYLPKDLTVRVKKRLYDYDMDFSDLIADLLLQWDVEEAAKDN